MRKYTKEEKKRLLKCSDCIIKVKDHKIIYRDSFKTHALKENKEGKNPLKIFIQAGLPLEILGRSYPKDIFKSWRRTYKIKEKKAYEEIFNKKLAEHLKNFFKNEDIDYIRHLKDKPFEKMTSKDLIHLTAYALEENRYLKKAFAIGTKKKQKKKK